jgi:hypothetical protein
LAPTATPARRKRSDARKVVCEGGGERLQGARTNWPELVDDISDSVRA